MKKECQNWKSVRIYATSDTHDKHMKIQMQSLPKADIFIHAGDFTRCSGKAQLQRFGQFLKMLPYKHKIVIAGNHDFALNKQSYQNHLKNTKHKEQALHPQEQIRKLKQCCTYLQHEMVEVEGVRIFGTPHPPEFFDWAFAYALDQGQQLWTTIPQNIDVLITHPPPHGILDRTNSKNNAGCKGLLKFVQKMKPKIHIFGHIHEGYGKVKIDDTDYYNASYVNKAYQPCNQPFLIDVKVKVQDKFEQIQNKRDLQA